MTTLPQPAQPPTALLLAQLMQHRQAGRTREAEHSLRALELAAASQPASAAAQVDLGQGLRSAGRYAEAATHFQRAAALQPGNAQIQLLCLLHQGTWLDEQGRAEEAMASFLQATQQHPESADAWATLGTVQLHLGSAADAAASLQRALQIDPGRTAVIERFALALQDQGRFEDAAIVFERLMKLEPARPLIPGRLMHCKMLIADWTLLAVLQSHVESTLADGHLSAEPFGLQGFCASPALLAQGAQRFAQRYFPAASHSLPKAAPRHPDKIRIGYVSGEFRVQATSLLLTEVLERHDRSRFDVVAFDNGHSDHSPLRRRIEAAADVVPIRGVGNLEVARQVRARGIDILLNLNGYFGQARNHVFALRPAAVQVNYLGFPGTLGAGYMDYIIADRTVIPLAEQAHYTEKVVYLPHSYQPSDTTRRVAATPSRRAELGLPEDAFVFCCMNNVYKIVPAMFEVWMRVLRRVPGSVLWLYSKQPEAQGNLRAEAQARGIDAQRILFAEPLIHEEHLARLRLADLFLDTLPYNAHTTGSDALWAGLPVLTCLGTSFPGRVGASLLRAVGLTELVTASLVEYEDLAVCLATEPARLKSLRDKLAAQLTQAPLFKTAQYTLHLESAYETMVQRARAGLPPCALDGAVAT